VTSESPKKSPSTKPKARPKKSKASAKEAAQKSPESPPKIPDKLYFRIGEVAQLVSVDAHVLRYWESEFKMKPHRSASGQRLYRKQDLSSFLRIKQLLHEEGYTIAGARRVLTGGARPQHTVNPDRIRDALKRLEKIRQKLSHYQQEIDRP